MDRRTRTEREPGARSALLFLCLGVLLFYGRLLVGHITFSSDTFPYILGEKLLIRDQLMQGRLPVMNPYVLCGAPLLENIAAGVLNPLNALLLFGTPLFGYHLFIVIHYMLAALGFHLLLRRGFSACPWAAATGALAYATGGYLWSMVDHMFYAAAAWVPLYFLGLMRAYRAKAPPEARRWLLLSVCALALLLTCGNFQQAYDALLLGGALTALAVIRLTRAKAWAQVRRLLLCQAGVAAAGLCLAAPQLLPTMMATLRSYRAGGLPLAEACAWSVPPARLVEYVVPFFFGARQGYGLAVTPFYGEQTAWSHCVFVGLPLIAGALSLRLARRDWAEWWVVLVLTGGLVMAFGRHTPIYALAHMVLPGFAAFRHPEKYLFWVHFALLILGALGLTHAARSAEAAARLRSSCRALVIVVLLIACTIVGLYAFRRSDYAALARHLGTAWPVGEFFTWQTGHCVGTVLALTLYWLGLRRGSRLASQQRSTRLALGVTAVHLLALGALVRWAVPVAWLERVTPAAESIPQQDARRYRVYSEPAVRTPVGGPLRERAPFVASRLATYARMTGNAPAIFKLSTFAGFSPLLDSDYIDFTNFRKHNPQAIMDLLCVRHLILEATVDAAGLPPGVRVLSVNQLDGYAVVENSRALPRIHTGARHVMTRPGMAAAEAFRLIELQDVAPAVTDGLAERQCPPIVLTEAPRQPAGVVVDEEEADLQVLQDDPGRIAVRCTGPIWLVVRDWFLPGWRARIDRRDPAVIYRADGAHMALFVPVGEHRLDLRYRPPGLIAGVGIAVLAAGLLAVTAWRLGVRAPASAYSQSETGAAAGSEG